MTFRAGLALNSIGSTADPLIQRRNKLIVRLQQQIALVQDPQFTLTRQKWIADENGIKQLRELKKRVRAWWRTDPTGAVVLTVRYGAKPIEFEKGKAGIAVPSKEKLIGVIETLIAAVKAGELDEVLAQQGRARGVPKTKRAA